MSSPADFVFRQLQPLFFSGDAETAHERVLSSVEIVSKIPGVIQFLRWQFRKESPVLHTKLFGKTVNNPIGLAAGFDKDGRIYPALFALGFGFVEMSDDSSATAAIESLNGKNFQGRNLTVNEAKPRENRF